MIASALEMHWVRKMRERKREVTKMYILLTITKVPISKSQCGKYLSSARILALEKDQILENITEAEKDADQIIENILKKGKL